MSLESKISLLHEYLARLRKKMNISWEAYEADEDLRMSVERNLQLVIECAIDISHRLHYINGPYLSRAMTRSWSSRRLDWSKLHLQNNLPRQPDSGIA